MKISGSDFSSIYALHKNNTKYNKAKKASFASMMNAGIQDSVTISGGRELSDEEFISALSRRISAEVRMGTPAEDVNDIKQQIALGTYDINVNEIVKKILS